MCVFHLGLDFLHSCFVTQAVRPGFKFRLSLLFLFFFLVQSQITVRTLQRMRQVPWAWVPIERIAPATLLRTSGALWIGSSRFLFSLIRRVVSPTGCDVKRSDWRASPSSILFFCSWAFSWGPIWAYRGWSRWWCSSSRNSLPGCQVSQLSLHHSDTMMQMLFPMK